MNHKLTEYLQVQLPKCIVAYQFIEEALKTCLRAQHAIVHGKLRDVLPSNPPISEINKAPMGKLLKYFEVFSDDKELLCKLREIVTKRNSVAHQAYLLTYEEQKNESVIENKSKQALKDLAYANECLTRLHAEATKLEQVVNDIFD